MYLYVNTNLYSATLNAHQNQKKWKLPAQQLLMEIPLQHGKPDGDYPQHRAHCFSQSEARKAYAAHLAVLGTGILTGLLAASHPAALEPWWGTKNSEMSC